MSDATYATLLTIDGRPRARLRVQQVAKSVVRAAVYRGPDASPTWSDVEDFHPKDVALDGGRGWGWEAPAEAPLDSAPPRIPVGQRVGYVRVSTADQNTNRQLDGIQLDRVFTDKASGATADRPALQELLGYVRDGDTVLVHSLDRLGRSLRDVQAIIEGLTDRGVRVEIVGQGLVFTGTDSPMTTLLLHMLGAVAEFELAQIRERQAQGIAKAKAAGKYTGRKPALDSAQADQVRRRAAAGESKAAIARDMGVSRATVYNYLTP